MDDLPVFMVLAFGLLMLLSHLAGAAMANWSFRDQGRYQEALLAEWQQLRAENTDQREQIFQLRAELLELRQRLNAAEDQVATLSSQLTTDG